MTVPARSNQTSGGRWYRPTEKKNGADVASAARTATGQSAAFNIEDAVEIDAQLAVTAASGTSPTLALTLQTSQDGVTWLQQGPTPPNVTGVSTTNYTFPCPGVYGRWVWTIGGTTPNFTFSVDHQAVVAAV